MKTRKVLHARLVDLRIAYNKLAGCKERACECSQTYKCIHCDGLDDLRGTVQGLQDLVDFLDSEKICCRLLPFAGVIPGVVRIDPDGRKAKSFEPSGLEPVA